MADGNHRNQQRGRTARQPSQRQLKIGEEIRHLVADILHRGSFHDPVLETVSVTITEVSVSPDLSNARLFVMPLGGTEQEAVLASLNQLAKPIQNQLARRLSTRRTPKIRFVTDTSFEVAGRLDSLIRANRQTEALAAEPIDKEHG